MRRPRICAVVTTGDPAATRKVASLVDLFEIRIDLIGKGWQGLAKDLQKPWIACNRSASEGGKWTGKESDRIEQLLEAVELGTAIIDVELATVDSDRTIREIKKKVKCIVSHHDFNKTPSLSEMKKIVQQQLAAGADICKVVTTALRPEDNLKTLQLIAEFPEKRIVSFAMGPLGLASRILCPIAGGDFTYASITAGKESAPGQVTVRQLRKIYGTLRNG